MTTPEELRAAAERVKRYEAAKDLQRERIWRQKNFASYMRAKSLLAHAMIERLELEQKGGGS